MLQIALLNSPTSFLSAKVRTFYLCTPWFPTPCTLQRPNVKTSQVSLAMRDSQSFTDRVSYPAGVHIFLHGLLHKNCSATFFFLCISIHQMVRDVFCRSMQTDMPVVYYLLMLSCPTLMYLSTSCTGICTGGVDPCSFIDRVGIPRFRVDVVDCRSTHARGRGRTAF